MGESSWRLQASTASVGSATGATPRLCTHRKAYSGGLRYGTTGSGSAGSGTSPQQSSPSLISAAAESSPPCSTPKERDRSNQIDLAHIRLRPEIQANSPPCCCSDRDQRVWGTSHLLLPQQQGEQTHHHHHRPVNEKLDNYMVIRQKCFRGLLRSKRDMRQLPQTDPREDQGVSPDWMHRSKTDIYIERRRAKMASTATTARGGSGGYNLSGMTLNGLIRQLPFPGKRDHEGNTLASRDGSGRHHGAPGSTRRRRLTDGSATTDALPQESRFPPLTINRMKQLIHKDTKTLSRMDHGRPSTTNGLAPTSSAAALPVPGPPPNSPPLPERDVPRQHAKRGRLRKEPVASVRLSLWEPSLDYALRSDTKLLQSRSAVLSSVHSRHT